MLQHSAVSLLGSPNISAKIEGQIGGQI